MVRAALLTLLACGPVRDPGAAQAASCPKACATDCTCLPSGFCSDATRTASQLGLGPIVSGARWRIELPGFPAAAEVTFALHAGLLYQGTDEGRVYVKVQVADAGNLGGWAARGEPPAWQDFEFTGRAGADGVARVDLAMLSCGATAGSTCAVAPASSFAARLVDTAPFLQAPPCAR